MRSRFLIFVLVFTGLFSFAALPQTQPTPRTVRVEGAVQKPGTYEMKTTGLSLLQAVAMSGGLQQTADSRKTKVVRLNLQAVDGALTETILVDLRSIITGKEKDFLLQPGDLISVPSKLPPQRLPEDPPNGPIRRA